MRKSNNSYSTAHVGGIDVSVYCCVIVLLLLRHQCCHCCCVVAVSVLNSNHSLTYIHTAITYTKWNRDAFYIEVYNQHSNIAVYLERNRKLNEIYDLQRYESAKS